MSGRWVILDRDLAVLYGVTTSALNQAVKRNIQRFPPDFMFQLTDEETENWKSQIVISNSITMGLRRNPNAFTEQGVAMRNYITTSTQVTAELAEIRAKLVLLERNDENNLEAVNDLSEDISNMTSNLKSHSVTQRENETIF